MWLYLLNFTGWSTCSCRFGCPNWCRCPSWQHWTWSISDLFLPGLYFWLRWFGFPFIWNIVPYAIVFQVLNIPTKINKGTVEIITPVELIKKGDKVGSSEAALLAKLGIRPFSYGLVVLSVYDNGSVFSPEVLNLTDEDLIEKFFAGVSMVTSLSLALSYPTLAAAPHMFTNAYKNVLALAVATEYSFPQAEKVKEYLKVFYSSVLVMLFEFLTFI